MDEIDITMSIFTSRGRVEICRCVSFETRVCIKYASPGSSALGLDLGKISRSQDIQMELSEKVLLTFFSRSRRIPRKRSTAYSLRSPVHEAHVCTITPAQHYYIKRSLYFGREWYSNVRTVWTLA